MYSKKYTSFVIVLILSCIISTCTSNQISEDVGKAINQKLNENIEKVEDVVVQFENAAKQVIDELKVEHQRQELLGEVKHDSLRDSATNYIWGLLDKIQSYLPKNNDKVSKVEEAFSSGQNNNIGSSIGDSTGASTSPQFQSINGLSGASQSSGSSTGGTGDSGSKTTNEAIIFSSKVSTTDRQESIIGQVAITAKDSLGATITGLGGASSTAKVGGQITSGRAQGQVITGGDNTGTVGRGALTTASSVANTVGEFLGGSRTGGSSSAGTVGNVISDSWTSIGKVASGNGNSLSETIGTTGDTLAHTFAGTDSVGVTGFHIITKTFNLIAGGKFNSDQQYIDKSYGSVPSQDKEEIKKRLQSAHQQLQEQSPAIYQSMKSEDLKNLDDEVIRNTLKEMQIQRENQDIGQQNQEDQEQLIDLQNREPGLYNNQQDLKQEKRANQQELINYELNLQEDQEQYELLLNQLYDEQQQQQPQKVSNKQQLEEQQINSPEDIQYQLNHLNQPFQDDYHNDQAEELKDDDYNFNDQQINNGQFENNVEEVSDLNDANDNVEQVNNNNNNNNNNFKVEKSKKSAEQVEIALENERLYLQEVEDAPERLYEEIHNSNLNKAVQEAEAIERQQNGNGSPDVNSHKIVTQMENNEATNEQDAIEQAQHLQRIENGEDIDEYEAVQHEAAFLDENEQDAAKLQNEMNQLELLLEENEEEQFSNKNLQQLDENENQQQEQQQQQQVQATNVEQQIVEQLKVIKEFQRQDQQKKQKIQQENDAVYLSDVEKAQLELDAELAKNNKQENQDENLVQEKQQSPDQIKNQLKNIQHEQQIQEQQDKLNQEKNQQLLEQEQNQK
ncbi:hypothetical protein ACTFIW_007155 [Dictyostelium discoideum]